MLALIGLSLFRVALARLAFRLLFSWSMAGEAVSVVEASRGVTAVFVGLDGV
ncbi:hypothetical protein FHW68_002599 [Pseudomonas sp. Tn43]|nr:hypothetical protein [Pseudomonas sp. Tn43]